MRDESPSWTALVIAYVVIMLGQTACKLLPPRIVPIQMALLEAMDLPWKDYYFLLLLRSPIGPIISKFTHLWVSFLFCKDALECIAFRKSFIEQHVCQFLQTNKAAKPQVLILGAGYDTLSLRIAKNYPFATFYEIDHPATGDFRNDKLWNHDTSKGPFRVLGEKPKNLHTLTADLTQKNALVQALKEDSCYSTSSPSIVIMEGLTMYLTREQVHDMFDEIQKAVGPKSQAAFDMPKTTYDDENNDHSQRPYVGRITSFVVLYLKIKDEPWHLGMDIKILNEFLSESNSPWSLCSEIHSMGPINVVAVMLNK